MSERRRVYRDAYGIKRTLIWDDGDPDQFHILTEQDLEPILDAVARDREIMANNGDNRLTHHVPAIVYEQACREGWDEGDWRKWYNGEGRPFAVYKGRV
jgi:hypothetical protein